MIRADGQEKGIIYLSRVSRVSGLSRFSHLDSVEMQLQGLGRKPN